jgi:4-hydroxybenzoate polyprenyl transferase
MLPVRRSFRSVAGQIGRFNGIAQPVMIVNRASAQKWMPCCSAVACRALSRGGEKYRDQNDTWVDRLSPRFAQLVPYLKLVRIDRPIGTWLVLLPGIWGLALAAAPGALPGVPLLLLFSAGAFVMRGAGCTVNDMWDMRYDAQVARTSQRPLAKGSVTLPRAVVFLGAQLSVGLAILCTLPPAAISFGVAVVPVVVLYPLLKRFTYWPQVALGVAMNWGVFMGWVAVHGSVDGLLFDGPLALYCGGVLWTLVYDTIYAHQDKLDDARLGLKSTALRLAEQTRPVLLACAAGAGGLWTVAGLQADLAWPFFAACGVAASQMAWQVWSADYSDRASLAHRFNSNKWVGLAIVAGLVAGRVMAAPTS